MLEFLFDILEDVIGGWLSGLTYRSQLRKAHKKILKAEGCSEQEIRDAVHGMVSQVLTAVRNRDSGSLNSLLDLEALDHVDRMIARYRKLELLPVPDTLYFKGLDLQKVYLDSGRFVTEVRMGFVAVFDTEEEPYSKDPGKKKKQETGSMSAVWYLTPGKGMGGIEWNIAEQKSFSFT